jgi:hypothetical protein
MDKTELLSLNSLSKWDPEDYLRSVSSDYANLSDGFLRCRVEKWFPNIATQWLTLANTLGVELRLQEINPLLHTAPIPASLFVGSIGENLIGIGFEREAEELITEAILGSFTQLNDNIIVEYIARRLFASLGMVLGNEELVFYSEPKEDINQFLIEQFGCFKVIFVVNNRLGTVWISLSRNLVLELDGLWRRQIRALNKVEVNRVKLEFEIAQIYLPTLLIDNLVTDSCFDLERERTDLVVIKLGGKFWGNGRIVLVRDEDNHIVNYGIELINNKISSTNVAQTNEDITTFKMSVNFSTIEIDGNQLAEFSQVGAILRVPYEDGSIVNIETSTGFFGNAVLMSHQGRFAIKMQ